MNNVAAVHGGAVYTSGSLRLVHSTLTKNSTTASYGSGGGAYNLSNNAVTLNRSIIFGNTAASSPDLDTGSKFLIGSNFIGTATNTSTLTGSISTSNPLLDPLANNGGPTMTCALQTGSPAINAADGLYFDIQPTSDQRGYPIITTPDSGAYETQLGGTFALDQTGYGNYEGNNVSITIRRLGGSVGSASVRLTTTPGTASSADFAARPDTSASDILFNNGETSKTVTIALATDTLAEVNETFTVKLSKPSPGSAWGNPVSATVAIVSSTQPAGINKPPLLSLTSPSANGTVNVDVGGTLTLTGTATDDRGMAHAGVYLNGNVGTLLDAVLEKPGATSTNFKVVIGPTGLNTGLNTISTFCADGANQLAPTITRSFKVLRPLIVNLSGYGTVTSGYAPRSYREVGKPITVTATPSASYLFSGWTILSSHSVSDIGVGALS